MAPVDLLPPLVPVPLDPVPLVPEVPPPVLPVLLLPVLVPPEFVPELAPPFVGVDAEWLLPPHAARASDSRREHREVLSWRVAVFMFHPGSVAILDGVAAGVR